MMPIENKKIAIVGGGPGGLTLARLLQMKGAHVTVYERDVNKDARVQGATLDLHEESGLAALKKAGLLDAFKTHYRPGADKLRVVDQNASIFFDEHAIPQEDDFDSAFFRPEIDRGPLRKILLESLNLETVVWDCQFLAMTAIENGWKLDFKNGTSATADLVIGADGAYSKIRPFLTPIKAFYSGVTVVEGTVENSQKNCARIHELLKGGKLFAIGGEKTLIVSSKEHGHLSFYTGCKTDESWVQTCNLDFKQADQVLHWFKQEFSDWDTIWHELFVPHATSFVARPQYCMPLDQNWDPLPNLTMLGDAAHLMPPYAGEGVNMAMLDALMLSECLTSSQFKDTLSALASYEKDMRVRASEAAQNSLEQMASLHSANGLQELLHLFKAFDPSL